MKKEKIIRNIWDIAYPFTIYYVAEMAIMFIAMSMIGSEAEKYMLCQIIAALFVIPLMYFAFYRPDRVFRLKYRFGAKRNIINVLSIIVIAFLLGNALNNIILMSPLVESSAGYREATEHFYSSTLVLELIGSGLLVPVLEELVMRGIILERLLRMTEKTWLSIGISSLIFAAMHFNIVQFVFALLLGIALGIFAYKTGNVYGAIIGHITVNVLGVLRTELGWFKGLVDGTITAWTVSILMLIVGIILLAGYLGGSFEKE